MRLPLSLALMFTLVAAQAAPKPKPAQPTVKQLQSQVKQLSDERAELKERLAALDGLQQEAADARKSRDLAREEAGSLRKEIEQLKASMSENQHGLDNILGDLKKAKAEQATVQDENADLKKRLSEMETRLHGRTGDGAPVVLSSEVTPAKAMNLARLTPSVRKAHGVVVVNVLVSEAGDAMEVRLIQGLAGDGEWVAKANEACLDAAKRLVFDPARAADGKTPLKVWQGVGFYLE
ncbi:MAG: hypothetical protein H6Q00_2450 [Holophagaceae bacterium]|nr:hypothetical protein [Holophagaceae bacterium]